MVEYQYHILSWNYHNAPPPPPPKVPTPLTNSRTYESSYERAPQEQYETHGRHRRATVWVYRTNMHDVHYKAHLWYYNTALLILLSVVTSIIYRRTSPRAGRRAMKTRIISYRCLLYYDTTVRTYKILSTASSTPSPCPSELVSRGLQDSSTVQYNTMIGRRPRTSYERDPAVTVKTERTKAVWAEQESQAFRQTIPGSPQYTW